MRILQFMADGAAGGGATVVLGLIEGLVREGGFEVHLLTERGSYCAVEGAKRGATVHEGDFMGSRTSPEPVNRFNEVSAAIHPDVTHLHGGRAAFFGRQFLGRGVYTVHGYHFLRKPFLKRMAGWLGERKAAEHVDAVVFVCEYDRQLGARWKTVPGGAAQEVIYNGVAFGEMPSPVPVSKTVAYPNRLVPQKDPLMAVEVMRLLAPEGWRMTMMGGGELEPEVRRAIASYGLEWAIDVRGQVTRTEALEVLSRSRAMLMTSLWEGLPLAPLEAMAAGVPVVAPGVSGIPEIVESGVNGLLSEHSAEAYASALRVIEGEPERAAAFIEAGKATISAKFSWETCLARHVELYRRLLR